VEASSERIDGLVEVTSGVGVENLKPALEVVIKTEPRGFLPSPGAVIAAANRIADRKRSNAPRVNPGDPQGFQEKWMAEHNPERWTTEMWRAFKVLMNAGGTYAQRVSQLSDERHAWAEEQTRTEISGKPVSIKYRLKLRKEYNRESRVRFPNPDPLTWDASLGYSL
jgi:hypothetical protein